MSVSIDWSDILVIIMYLAFVLALGIRYSKKSESSETQFYLANREIRWVPLMFSIVATETSTLTFLSLPGISYAGNWTFLQFAFGYILGRTFTAFFLLPKYYDKGYTSVYEWIGSEFGKISQKTLSFLFSGTRVLGDGVRVFASSIPVAMILRHFLTQDSPSNPEVHWQAGIGSLLLLSATTTIYTMKGGFRSVVFIDAVQFLIYILGGLFSLYILLGDLLSDPVRFQSLWQQAESISKWKILELQNWKSNYFWIWAVLGGAVLSVGTHGVDQMFVQRLLAAKTKLDAQKALIVSGITVFLQFALFLAIGTLLWIYYQGSEMAQDEIFSRFILENVPSPIQGFLLAAILASAMSTLSSSINSLSVTSRYDWNWKRIGPSGLSLFWGSILFLSSLLPFYLTGVIKEGILELGLKIASFTLGPMVFLFFSPAYLGALGRQYFSDRKMSAIILLSVLGNLLLYRFFHLGFSLLVPAGFLIAAALCYLLSLKGKFIEGSNP